ncbi:pre-rRNA-processing protein TSR2 homolog isoform X2 [Thrips palmi]|nr:pre-rRNA-processing protein TSR2 homolog isoform X2 [Thrips palmi]
MGGADGYNKAMGMIDAVVELFRNKPDAGWDEVADILGDMMDDEFNTICEDDSTDEVGSLLWEFYKHCCSGDQALVEQELEKLPSGNWLNKCLNQSHPTAPQDDSDDDDDGDDAQGGPSTSNGQNQMDAEMGPQGEDPDPGWTQVRRKR